MLSGRLEAKYLPELQRLLDSEEGRGRVTLDLSEVNLVDRDAVRFLGHREADGATLENCAPYIREWITREKAEGGA